MAKKRLLFWVFVLLCFVYFLFRGFNELYFLRQPVRNIPNDDNLFVSPANWTVIKVIHQDDLKNWETELYKQNNVVIDDWTKWFSWSTLVSIMMTPMDAHFQKAPLYSKLIGQEYHKWHFFNATKSHDNMKSTFQNEYNTMLYITPEWYKFRIIQIAWLMAWRIVSLLDIDDIVEQWQFIWAIKLWSQVSIVLDSNFEVNVKEWDYVIDWETILATKKDNNSIASWFDEGNIVWNEEIDINVDNVLRYSFFEMFHPSLFVTIIWFIILIVQILSGYKVCIKAWLNGWEAFIPIYNSFLPFKIAWKMKWAFTLILFPVILLILLHSGLFSYLLNNNLTITLYVLSLSMILLPWIVIQFYVAKKFWKSNRFALWLWFCPMIFYPYLAWMDNSPYKK